MDKTRTVEAIAVQALFSELYRHYMGEWDPTGNLLVWHSPRLCLVPTGRDWYEIAFAAWLVSLGFEKLRGFAAAYEGIKEGTGDIMENPRARRELFKNWFLQNVVPLDEIAYNNEVIVTLPEALLAFRLLLPRLKVNEPTAVTHEPEWTIWEFLAVQAGASWVEPTEANIAEVRRALAAIVIGTLQGLAYGGGDTGFWETLIGKEKSNDLVAKARQFGAEGLVWLYEYVKENVPDLLEIDLDKQVEGSSHDLTSGAWMIILLNGMGLAYSLRYIADLPRNFVNATQRRLLAWFRGMKIDIVSWLNS
jgi:hypothetical protein